MNGMAYSKAFFVSQGLPALRAHHEEVLPFLAAGLVGEGSECFEADDALSRDHDWGCGFCIWLPTGVYQEQGASIARTLRGLRTGPGIASKFPRMGAVNDGRVGVFSIEEFYRRFIGFSHPPRTLEEWWVIPDANLATATNGKVFCDSLGDFTAWRDTLKSGYPRDIKLKKLAYCCYSALQAGPYNYRRMMRRDQRTAALLAQTTFMTAALRITYYLNDAYPPFYKWLAPLVQELPLLGEASYHYAELIAEPNSNGPNLWPRTACYIDEWCKEIKRALCACGLVAGTDGDLYDCAIELHRAIQTDWLRAIPLEAPC